MKIAQFRKTRDHWLGLVFSQDITIGEMQDCLDSGAQIEMGLAGPGILWLTFPQEVMSKKDRDYERSKDEALERDWQSQVDYEKTLDL